MADDEQKIGEEGASTGAFQASETAGDFTVPVGESLFADEAEARASDPPGEKPAKKPAPTEPETAPTTNNQPDDTAPQQPLPVTPQQEEQVQQAVATYFDAAEQVLDQLEAISTQQAQEQEAREDGQRIEMSQEVIAQLAEIRALIAHMRSADADGSVSDEIADLETAHASLMAILSAVHAGGSMAGLAGLKTLIQGAKQTAENAISDAGVSYDVAKADLRSEKYYDLYQQVEQARINYMRDAMLQTEFFARNDELFSTFIPGYDKLPDELRSQISVDLFTIGQKDPDVLRDSVINKRVTPELADQFKAEKEQRLADLRELLQDSTIPEERKAAMRELWALHNVGGFNEYLSPDMHELLEKIATGELSDAEIAEALQKEKSQQSRVIDNTIYALAKNDPKAYQELLQEAGNAGMSLREYLAQHAQAQDQIDPDTALGRASLTLHAMRTQSEVADYYKEYAKAQGINLDEIMQASPEKLQQMLQEGDEGLQKLNELMAMSPTDLVDKMVDDGALPKHLRDDAITMARVVDTVAATIEDPEQRSHAKLLFVQNIDSLNRQEGESEGQWLERIGTQAREMEQKLGLESHTLSIATQGDLIAQMRESSSNMSDTEFEKHFSQVIIERREALVIEEYDQKWKSVVDLIRSNDPNLVYNSDTKAIEDIQAQQSLSPQEAQRRAQEDAMGKSSTLSPEGEVVIQSSQPENAPERLNAIRADSLSSAPAQAAVTVQGGMVALEPEGPSSALPKPANENMLNALKQAQGQGAIPSTGVAYSPADGSPAASQMSSMPDTLPSLEVSGGDEVGAEQVRKQNTPAAPASPAAGAAHGPR